MPWQWGTFRGKRVLVRVTAPGAPALVGGRVEIRFREGDGRTYPARGDNVSVPASGALVEDGAAVVRVDAGEPPARAAKRDAAPARAALEAPPPGAWIAYTDGACTGNPGPAGSGLVLLDAAGELVREAYRYLGQGTNNIAELTAVEMALDALPQGAAAVVHTDSKYAIGVLSKGWKVKANVELVLRIKGKLAARSVRLRYVPGHSGVPLNERADELAREAIATRRSTE